MAALKKYSNLSEQRILENLKIGTGPKIVVKDIGLSSGQYDKNLNTISIDVDIANDQNYLKLGQATAFEFFLTTIILHEYVHFGNGLTMKYPADQYGNDAGFQFEGKYYGGKVQFDLSTPNFIWFKLLSDPD